MAGPQITVAIVSWNTRDLLARCLDSFHPEFERGLVEVWVVDNASSDGSADLVRERYPWVQLIASQDNHGFGRALNLVAERTHAPWIAVANADIAVHPGALDALLEAGARDPRAGAIGPRLRMPNGNTQHSAFAFPTIAFTLLHTLGAFRVSPAIGDRMAFPGRWDTERRRRVPWLIAAFLLVRRQAWDEVGGFDDRQWMYAEDLDLGWRLRQAGWFTRYEPSAVVEHEVAASTSQQFEGDRSPVWQKATYESIAWRRGPLYARAVAAINLLGALRRWPKYARDPAAREAHRQWTLTHLRAATRGR